MTSRKHDPQLDELGNDSSQPEADSGGQTGDSQGLPAVAEVANESVEELAESGQSFEAEILEGIEDAADHPEQPVRTREDQGHFPELAPLPGTD
jgi:hypothetical protein